jgi:hypothetical protein
MKDKNKESNCTKSSLEGTHVSVYLKEDNAEFKVSSGVINKHGCFSFTPTKPGEYIIRAFFK